MVEKKIGDKVVKLVRGDITDMEVEAFVFDITDDCKLGSGYGGAIAQRGGKVIQDALDEIGSLAEGQAVMTTAGEMKAEKIIHVNGPKYHAGDTEAILRAATRAALELADEEGVKPIGFTSDARSALLTEEWLGNVRELAERVRQAIKLSGNAAITAEALLLAAEGENIPSFKEAKRAFEARYVTGLLRRCSGNISRAARLAKKDRKDFYDVIRRTGVDPADFR